MLQPRLVKVEPLPQMKLRLSYETGERLLEQNYNKSVDSPEILQSLPKILLIFL